MTAPRTDIPSQYEINTEDDRKLTGLDSANYLALASALDALSDIERGSFHPQALRALRTAENALRRAAWITVVHAKAQP